MTERGQYGTQFCEFQGSSVHRHPVSLTDALCGQTLQHVAAGTLTAADHVRLLHPRPGGTISFAMLHNGAWCEKTAPRGSAEETAGLLEGMADVYVSTQPMRGWRGTERLAALRTLYADLDTYRIPELAGLPPEAICSLVLAHVSRLGWPEPTLVLFTGRGLAVSWMFDDVPAGALPRWQAVERHLVTALGRFGADLAATDAARVLRLAGSVNDRSGEVVRLLHRGSRPTFETMAAAVLPMTRERLKAVRTESAVRRAERRAAPHRVTPTAARPPPSLTRGTWAAAFTEDLHRLIRHRFGGETVRVGQRDLFLFCFAVPAAHAGSPEQAAADVRGAAIFVGWSEQRAMRKAGTALRKARQAFAGEKRAVGDRMVDPRYTPRSSTIAGWLGVTADDARAADLRLLAPPEVRAERERERWHVRRERAGSLPRARFEEEARLRAARAAALREAGVKWLDVAEALGLPSAVAARVVAKRHTGVSAVGSVSMDAASLKERQVLPKPPCPLRCDKRIRSLRVSSGVAPQEAAFRPSAEAVRSASAASRTPTLPPGADHSPSESPGLRTDVLLNLAAAMRKRGAEVLSLPPLSIHASRDERDAHRQATTARADAMRRQAARDDRDEAREEADERQAAMMQWVEEQAATGSAPSWHRFIAGQEVEWDTWADILREGGAGRAEMTRHDMRRKLAFRKYHSEWRAASARAGMTAGELVHSGEFGRAVLAVRRQPRSRSAGTFRIAPDAVDKAVADAGRAMPPGEGTTLPAPPRPSFLSQRRPAHGCPLWKSRHGDLGMIASVSGDG